MKKTKDNIKIVSLPEEEMGLQPNNCVVKRQTKIERANNKLIILIILTVIIIVCISLLFILPNEQAATEEQRTPLHEQPIDKVVGLADSSQNTVEKITEVNETIESNSQQNQNFKEENQINEQEVPEKESAKTVQPVELYKKLVNPLSSYHTNRPLNFYLKKRRRNYQQIIASIKKQDQQVLKQHLQTANITIPQFLSAITLIQYSPFLQFKQPKTTNLIDQQQTYYQTKYNISAYQELPICVVVPSFRNYKRYRYYLNLYTILQQEYNNYKIVIIDDASADQTAENLQKQISTNAVAKEKIILIKNKKRQHHMANIHKAVHNHCTKGQLLMIIDGDDQLIGKFVFKMINAVYHRLNSLAIYTNHIQSKRQVLLDIGISRPYSQETKKNNSYRFQRHYYSHLRTTWVDLFLLISEDAFKDSRGQWFTNAVDNAIFYPIFEMSCGEVEYLNEITYKYNTYTGNNVDNIQEQYRRSTSKQIRTKQTYKCLKEWNVQAYNKIKSYLK